MKKHIKLAVFDVDGTIKTNDGVPHSVIKGINHIQNHGIKSTVLTGKGYPLLQHRFGNQWDEIISPGIPVGVENGGRIVEPTNNKTIKYYPLEEEELKIIKKLVIANSELVEVVAYHPIDNTMPMRVWTNNNDLARRLKESKQYTTSFSESPYNFLSTMQNLRPCMAVLQTKDGFREMIPSNLNVIRNEGVLNINKKSVNKGTGLTDISEITGIPLNKMLVAGNNENDIPMFEIPVAMKLYVGNNNTSRNIPSAISIDTPSELGNYLLKL